MEVAEASSDHPKSDRGHALELHGSMSWLPPSIRRSRSLALAHIHFGKPVSTFPAYALIRKNSLKARCIRLRCRTREDDMRVKPAVGLHTGGIDPHAAEPIENALLLSGRGKTALLQQPGRSIRDVAALSQRFFRRAEVEH